MSALVRVDDFRFLTRQSSFQAVEYKGFIECAGQFIVDDIATVPVNNDEQIHEAFGHVNVGNVDPPDLIGMDDRKMAQQVGFDEL